MAPSCSISPPIVGVVNGDDTEMAYFVTDILLQEFQNSWQNIRPATFRTFDLEIEEQIHIRITCSSVIATYRRMRNSTLFGCAFSGQMEQRTIPKVSTLKILSLCQLRSKHKTFLDREKCNLYYTNDFLLASLQDCRTSCKCRY